MRSFLKSSAGFLLGAVLIAALLSRISNSLSPPYRMKEKRIALLEQRAAEVEVLGIGASHGTSLDYPAMGVEGFHFWTLGEDLFETEAIVRAYVPQLPSLEVLLLPLTVGSFVLDNGIEVTEDRSQHRRIFYATHPSWEILGFDYENYVGGKMYGIVRLDHWRGVFRSLGKRMQGVEVAGAQGAIKTITDDGFLVRIADDEHLSLEELEVDARKQHARQRILRRDMLAGNPNLREETFQALLRCIRFARERGVRIILLSTPMVPAYRKGIDPDQEAAFRALIERAVRQEGVEYHDFMEDPAFIHEERYFFNADHMNRVGAREFSRLRIRPLLESSPGEG